MVARTPGASATLAPPAPQKKPAPLDTGLLLPNPNVHVNASSTDPYGIRSPAKPGLPGTPSLSMPGTAVPPSTSVSAPQLPAPPAAPRAPSVPVAPGGELPPSTAPAETTGGYGHVQGGLPSGTLTTPPPPPPPGTSPVPLGLQGIPQATDLGGSAFASQPTLHMNGGLAPGGAETGGPIGDPVPGQQPVLGGLRPGGAETGPIGDPAPGSLPTLGGGYGGGSPLGHMGPAPTMLRQIQADPYGGMMQATALGSFGSLRDGMGDPTAASPVEGYTGLGLQASPQASGPDGWGGVGAQMVASRLAPEGPTDVGGSALPMASILSGLQSQPTVSGGDGGGTVPSAPTVPGTPPPATMAGALQAPGGPTDVSPTGRLPTMAGVLQATAAPTATASPPPRALQPGSVQGPTDIGGVTAPGNAQFSPYTTTTAQPGLSLTPFTAADNLRGYQINPLPSAAVQGAQALTDRSAQSLGSFNGLQGWSSVPAGGDLYTAGADRQAADAEAYTRGAGLGPMQQIAGTNLSDATRTLGASEAYARAAGLGSMQQIGGTDLARAGQTLNSAEGLIAGASGNSPEAQAARAAAMSGLSSLTGAPNRAQLASDAFNLIQQRGQPQYQQDLRSVGQKAAALGRIGAGMTTNDLTDVFSQRERDLDLSSKELANTAAGQELADRTNILNSSLGALGTFGGEDRAGGAFGLSQGQALGSIANQRTGMAQIGRQDAESDRSYGLQYGQANAANQLAQSGALGNIANQRTGMAQIGRQDAESDRNYGLTYGQANASNRLAQGNALAALSGQQFAQGQSLRNEARGERTDQTNQQLADLTARTGVLGSLGSYESQRYAQDAGQRGEARTERDYQNQLAQQGTANAAAQAALQDSLANSAAGRSNDQARIILGALGDPNSYQNALQNAGATGAAQGASQSSDAMNLLMQYFNSQRAGAGTAAPGATTGNVGIPAPNFIPPNYFQRGY